MEIILNSEQIKLIAEIIYRMPTPMLGSKPTQDEYVQTIINSYLQEQREYIDREKLLSGPSDIERAFQAERDNLKTAAITYLFMNQNCTQEELITYLEPSETFVKVSAFITLYIQGSFEKGYCEENTFESFKTFILSRTPEELMLI